MQKILIILSLLMPMLAWASDNSRKIKAEDPTEITQPTKRQKIDEAGQLDFKFLSRLGWVDNKKLQELLSRDGNINLQDGEDGMSVLMFAVRKNDIATVDLLLSKNANVNLADSYGRTALIFATENDNLEIVISLLKKEVDIDAQDNFAKDNALMRATKQKREKIVNILIKYGINVHAKDKKGKTALDKAEHIFNPYISNLLIKSMTLFSESIYKDYDQNKKRINIEFDPSKNNTPNTLFTHLIPDLAVICLQYLYKYPHNRFEYFISQKYPEKLGGFYELDKEGK